MTGPDGLPATEARGPIDVPPGVQRSWLRELGRFFRLYNYWYLGGRLSTPGFRLGPAAARLGEWDRSTRTLTIAIEHILRNPWRSVLDTLRHEMAHMVADEILGATDAQPHGREFQDACRLLRIAPERSAPAGALGRLEDSEDERDRILARVKLLLALARSPNEHEAANAMRMANRYLLEYNLDLSADGGPREYSCRQLGECCPRVQEYQYVLARILHEHFFVQVIWTYTYDPNRDVRGSVLEIYGTERNLEVAEYAWHFVMNLTEPLWKEHRKAARSARGTKLQYLAGLLRGFKEKLDAQRSEMAQERGLVWRGDPRLSEYFRHMNPKVQNVGTRGVSRGERFEAGRRDGRNITIHRGVGGDAGRRGRLLDGP